MEMEKKGEKCDILSFIDYQIYCIEMKYIV